MLVMTALLLFMHGSWRMSNPLSPIREQTHEMSLFELRMFLFLTNVSEKGEENSLLGLDAVLYSVLPGHKTTCYCADMRVCVSYFVSITNLVFPSTGSAQSLAMTIFHQLNTAVTAAAAASI